MVAAVAQDGVNTPHMDWLSKYKGDLVMKAYLGSKPVAVDSLKTDPFSIPNGTDASDPRIQALKKQGFSAAFKAEIGLPHINPSQLPLVIEFMEAGPKVNYNMYGKTFQIVSLEEVNKDEWVWTNASQAGTPWVFTFEVNLKLSTHPNVKDFLDRLPGPVKQEIEKNDPANFSVQQLFFDLNNPRLSRKPTITGVEKESHTYQLLTDYFIGAYLKQLRQDGGEMLGYAVVSDRPIQSSSFIPSAMDFEVSAYLKDGKPSEDHTFYTLNYLLMSGNRVLPPPQQFPWNWMEPGATTHGAMAVRREVFGEYLKQLLSPALSHVAKIPSTSMKIECDFPGAIYHYHESFANDPSPQHFEFFPATPSPLILSYHYSKKHEYDADGKVCPMWYDGSYNIDYNFNSQVIVEDNIIWLKGYMETKVYMSYGMGHINGLYQYNLERSYELKGHNRGTVTVEMGGAGITPFDSNGISPNLIARIEGDDNVQIRCDDLDRDLTSWMNSFFGDFDLVISNVLDGNTIWVFPGGETFTYQDIYFSENQDLVTQITYLTI